MRIRVVKVAFLTAGSLFGGIFLGILIGSIVHGLPTHLSEGIRVTLASIPALGGFIAGGALWGSLLSPFLPGVSRRRLILAGALGFGPTVIAVALLLSLGEVLLVQRARGPDLPIYIVYTLLFAPATLVVTAVGSGAIGAAIAGGKEGVRIGLRGGVVGAGAFLAVNVFMEALGWQVGAPGAARRATMVTVTLLGSLGAALAGGALLGWEMGRRGPGRDEVEHEKVALGDQSAGSM